MKLLSIQYREYPGSPEEWFLAKTVLDTSNLIVGKNATGKSRFIKVIAGLARLLTGEQRELFTTGHYQVELDIEQSKYLYLLDIEGKTIRNESLTVDDKVMFTRDAKGKGQIYAEELSVDIKFEVEPDVLIAQAKIDSVQHPYLVKLKTWASSVRLFEFGTELGRNQLLIPQGASNGIPKGLMQTASAQVPNSVGIIQKGLIEYGDSFSKNVLKDLADFGYNCTELGMGPVPNIESAPPLMGVYVIEKELGFKNFQLQISTGFFRALALIACVNYLTMSKHQGLILIDDIGEGLDYERASAVVKNLLKKAKKSNLQIVMTSNDRFIMNSVPLELWTVLDRKKGNVKPFNVTNASKAFEEFKSLGMNNFDFFATRSYNPSKTTKR